MENKKKLRVFFNVNAPWSTSGYGTQARDLLPLIARAGYPVACSAYYGLEGGKIELDGVLYYPKIADTWGVDAMVSHGNDFNADVVFSLQDIWVLDPNALKMIKRWIPIVPIDHEPAPSAIIQRLKLAYRIISYSQFGRDELKRQGLYSTYIPHTVNANILKPMNKKEAKKKLGIKDDMFIFGMVAANKDNPPRKSFQEAIDAFKLFHDRHPNSGMFFHTLLNQQGGFPINDYIKFLGLAEVCYHLQPYDQMYRVDRDGMAAIYNAFDCLLAPSTNEGFGVPIVEAQSCGVPVITNNFTAMPELIKPGVTGELCSVGSKRFTPLLSYVGIPDTRSIYEAMEKIYKTDRETMSKEARKHTLETYDIEKIFSEKWIPYLQTLEREIYPTA